MKKHQKFTAALTALLILSYCLPVFASETEIPSECVSGNTLLPDTAVVSENTLPSDADTLSESDVPSDEDTMSENTLFSDGITVSETAPLPNNAPMFNARIQLLSGGYVVKGTFTEFRDDISRIRTLYSLDGETYQECGEEWCLWDLDTDEPAAMQTQICLYDRMEPLKSYLNGTIDCFYLKLEITLNSGHTYESQTAVIDRGEPQPVPEDITLTAQFSSSVSVIEQNPLYCYGRYQLTVSPAATPEDIAALLPDTISVKVNLRHGRSNVADCTVYCPIAWKSLSLPWLTAGESITIPDAAGDIILPCGTLLRTPIGVFQLEEPLALMQDIVTSDEVRLVLNVTPTDGNPTGVLSQENDGLEVAFDLKPTSATAIHAYTFSEQNPKWVKLPDLALAETVNTHPSAANSGYTLVIRNDQEPYRSYLAAETAGDTPVPFLIGLKIEGGVYHGRQLVLPWPGTYELPPHLPKVGGNGGNDNNAGSDNKDDSTEEGQRPNLPQETEEKQTPKSSLTDSSQTPAERQKQPSDSSRTNQKSSFSRLQDPLRGLERTEEFPIAGHSASRNDIADSEGSSNDANALVSDSYDDPAQTSASAQETTIELAPLTPLPAEVLPSAEQEESYGHHTVSSRHRILLTAVAVAVCIAAAAAGLHVKNRASLDCEIRFANSNKRRNFLYRQKE